MTVSGSEPGKVKQSAKDRYRDKLRSMEDWDAYLLAESGLPGPRGNLELAQAVAEEGDAERFQHYLTYTSDLAPVNSPYEFLAFCGAVGLGRLLAEGDEAQLAVLRKLANDPRWRMREAVAMALQRLGDTNMPRLLDAMQDWARGSLLEQRAAAAALCEPKLLKQDEPARAVLGLLDQITATIEKRGENRSAEFQALRKGMGYCWSVAVAALPEEGKRLVEKWLQCSNPDIQWIMHENLKKKRLLRMDAAWVERVNQTKKG